MKSELYIYILDLENLGEDDVSSDSNDDDDFMDAEGESLEVRSKINKKFKRYVDGSSSSSDSNFMFCSLCCIG